MQTESIKFPAILRSKLFGMRLLQLLAVKRLVLFLLGVSAIAAEPVAELPTPAVLPKRVYAMTGEVCRVRFAEIVFSPIPNSVLFDVEEGPGAQFNDCLLWSPEPGAKTQALSIGICSGQDFRKLTSVRSEFWPSDPQSVKAVGVVRWLAIGDSLTAGGNYIRSTTDLLKSRMPAVVVETMGTQPPGGPPEKPRHEGRGGWTWKRYLTAGAGEPERSPFVFGEPKQETFDFRGYLEEQKVSPQIITIFLGVNDVSKISANYSPEKVNEIVQTAKTMVAKIREASPASAIGLIVPPSPSEQNGFGKNYGNGATEWQYRRTRQYYLEALMKEFDGRWAERIYIVSANLGFDPATSYPMVDGASQNALHPVAGGYQEIGRTLAAWIVHLISQRTIIPVSAP